MPDAPMESPDPDLAWLRLAGAPQPDGTVGPPIALDPYMLWALRTGLRSLRYGTPRQPGSLTPPAMPQALEFVLEQDPQQPPQPVPGMLDFEIPPAYAALPNGAIPRFVTLRLRTDGKTLPELQAALLLLAVWPGVRRLQLGTHRTLGAPEPPSDDEPDAAQHPPAAGQAAPTLVLGVLDDGCPFGHASLRQGASTRVASLWDQSSRRAQTAPWQLVPAFGYGAELTGTAMQALLARHTDAAGDVDETALYTAADVRMRHLVRRRSHAAAVVSLLAGDSTQQLHPPWPAHGTAEPGPDEDGPSHPPAAPADAASGLPMVAVQLPREQVLVTSGRWLAVKALDGLRYLVQAARRLAPANQPPAVIANLSYGGHAGAHDGTGLLESAVAELCAADPALAVVLAAGNSQGTRLDADDPLQRRRLPGGVHASGQLDPGGACAFTLLVPPDKQFETYLELWFSWPEPPGGGPLPQPQWLPPGEVRVRATAPDGRVLSASFPGMAHSPGLPLDADAGLICLTRVSQSSQRSMALLVVAATQNSRDRVEAPAGRWTVQLQHTGSSGQRWVVDAWVERDDTTVGAIRPQAARLVEDDANLHSALTDCDTLSHRCQALRVVSAGALLNRALPGEPWPAISPYSAEGAGPAFGPSFSALVDASDALPGMRCAGSQSGTVTRVNGSSLAAPQVARWLANRLAAGATLDAVLRAAAAQPGKTARRGAVVP